MIPNGPEEDGDVDDVPPPFALIVPVKLAPLPFVNKLEPTVDVPLVIPPNNGFICDPNDTIAELADDNVDDDGWMYPVE